MRDGELVCKVRFVGDGRAHYNVVMTYLATPSREELLIILHLIAALDWEYVHIDERAFLSAKYLLNVGCCVGTVCPTVLIQLYIS